VLVVTNMYPTEAEPHFGCFVKDQVDDLRGLGVDVSVLAFDGRSHKRRYLAAASRLRRALRGNRYDIVHAHYGLSGAVASVQLATPVVTTFHGSDARVGWQRHVSWIVARRTQPIAVALCADRPRRGPTRPRLASRGAMRPVSGRPQRPFQGQQARRPLRRDDRPAAAK
jgi:hypothetical protein